MLPILREHGYRALEASNGIAELELLEAEKGVHLLFTDVGLPGGLNRWQLADEARRRRQDLQPATHETPSFIKEARLRRRIDREAIHLCTLVAKIQRLLRRAA
jgi:CheY-like chemotaxis protein